MILLLFTIPGWSDGGSSRMQMPIGTSRGEPVSVVAFWCLLVWLWLIS